VLPEQASPDSYAGAFFPFSRRILEEEEEEEEEEKKPRGCEYRVNGTGAFLSPLCSPGKMIRYSKARLVIKYIA
jgi:hypothetical protein